MLFVTAASNTSSANGGAALLIILVGLVLYLIPTWIALMRHKTNVIQVILVNVLLGWSVIGWIVALVMAFGQTKSQLAGRSS